MRKMIMIMVAIFISATMFGTTNNVVKETNDLVIKQTVNLVDSDKPIIICYVKCNDVYKLYSNVDLSKQSVSTLKNVKSTKFELASKPEGTCQLTCKTLKEVVDLGYKLYGKYNKYIDFDKIEF
jgi:hypothetical protein